MSIIVMVIFVADNNVEHMVNIKPITGQGTYTRSSKCKYSMSETVQKVLDKYNVKYNSSDNAVIHMPCTYNDIAGEINNMKLTSNSNQRIFIVNNADELTSKQKLWRNLVKKYGRQKALEIVPVTYQLDNPNDMVLFNNEYDSNKIYILKKNIQRQEGLMITKDKDVILNAKNDKYVVCQELLQDPYTISGRKTNMRVYLLFVCQNGEISAWIHKNGFMYYTSELFEKGSVSEASNITTGYIDRQVYIDNPLTHEDYKKYLDNHKRPLTTNELSVMSSGHKLSEYVFNNIYETIRKAVNAMVDNVCYGSKLQPYITFQLFGVDVAVSEKLDVKIMEVNKGPDLGAKDERDKHVKQTVVHDMLKTIGVVNDNTVNGFIQIF